MELNEDQGDVGGSEQDYSCNPHNHNPTGKNQYKNCPRWDDPRLQELLRKYDREGVANRDQLSRLLRAQHNMHISATSIKRCRKKMGLQGSGATTRRMPTSVKRQLVLDQMEKDPNRRKGPRLIKEDIARETGVHLTREYVDMEMRVQDPDGFAIRHPNPKKIKRHTLIVPGPHFEWSGGGHDKLSSMGFPIWGIRDVWSGKLLGLWVVPNNRRKISIAYLYLSLVERLGGMPIQVTAECSSKSLQVYAFASALREIFSPEPSISEHPAHLFLESIHNTTIERGWLRLRLQWGDNLKVFWDRGSGIYGYNSDDPSQCELVQWLWPKLIQQELDVLRHRFNTHKVRKDRTKMNPSGVSPDVAIALPGEYGGENCLQPVDKTLIRNLMEELGGEDLIRFVSVEYAERARVAFESLDTELTMENVWHVFQTMMPLLYARN